MDTASSRWRVLVGGQGDAAIISGWFPAEFDWSIETLYTRTKQLQRVKLIYDVRPGQISASHPGFLFDQLPVPLLAEGLQIFPNSWEGFLPVSVMTGIAPRMRFNKWGRNLVIVPTPLVMYASPEEVPADRHFAVIDKVFCFSEELFAQEDFWFRKVVAVPFGTHHPRPAPSTPDFSAVFAKRVPSEEAVVEARILDFIFDHLQRYRAQYTAPLGALLLDSDPEYGYVILALKQTPVVERRHTDIEDFELDQYALLEADALYQGAAYLSATRLRAVFKRVIARLAQDARVRALAGTPLHLAYAFHDEAIHWLATVEGQATEP
jgi:hypothetical protein